jgi:hypothetical protein
MTGHHPQKAPQPQAPPPDLPPGRQTSPPQLLSRQTPRRPRHQPPRPRHDQPRQPEPPHARSLTNHDQLKLSGIGSGRRTPRGNICRKAPHENPVTNAHTTPRAKERLARAAILLDGRATSSAIASSSYLASQVGTIQRLISIPCSRTPQLKNSSRTSGAARDDVPAHDATPEERFHLACGCVDGPRIGGRQPGPQEDARDAYENEHHDQNDVG